ncbi:aminotransferase class I/II-fold pyridoxal phosphate-dependent enzyme [Sphingomonas sp. PAMC 26621]|uniref:aminotransferase class I/II-fold pyridoxal phosphate-dependent enzyme n=1 Tax=Sphingomonas sp. PAMC 26621 TaxID=1112213 RepID=UPI000288048E|nr:aminotransferase class I/II-fold pyridoxal phosphate-dependent enzyme [Sphingomonas sp. PAMC 26621]
MTPRDLALFHAHGGRVEAARAAFGGADWIDLSTGIAPWAWPVAGVDPGWERLPEPGAIAALEAAAAAAFGVADPAQVVAVPGTDLAMRVLAPLLGAKRSSLVRPGYAGHLAAWPDAVAVLADAVDALAGGQALPHPTRHPGLGPGSTVPRDQGPADTHPGGPRAKPGVTAGFAERGALNDADLLVLASPANPDGRVTDPALLRALAATMTVVVDEAYADPAPALCPHASDRLIVLRSFGKFYGLPGVRLGFVVAGQNLATRLRTLLGDWPVSSAAVAIGTAGYRDDRWRQAQASRIAETGTLLDEVLRDAGLDLIGHAPLFRLIACKAATRLFETLARHAILTRPFADQPDRLRIGLPRGAAGLVRLATALEEFPR